MAAAKPKPKPAAKAKPKPRAKRVPAKRSRAKTTPRAKQKADAAAKRAKAAGATGGRLTAAKTQLRDSAIFARKAQNVTNAVIAAEFSISERQVERILSNGRLVRSPLEDSPMDLLEELAVGFRLSIGDYEAMAHAWFDTNQAASLGAKKAADETRVRLATFLLDIGKLPTNLEVFRAETEMRRMAEEMARTMRAVAAGEMDASEAVEVFRRFFPGRQVPQLAAGRE